MHIILTFAVEPDTPDMIDFNDIFGLVLGFLEGMNVGKDVGSILECVKKFPDFIIRFERIIKEFKEMDVKNVIEFVRKVFVEITELMKDLVVCEHTAYNVIELTKKILQLGLGNIVMRVKLNFRLSFGYILEKVGVAKTHFDKKEYEKAGYGLELVV